MNELLYKRLSAHFEVHHKDPRGLEYLTGEQVVSRLNEVLGPGGWDFAVTQHGYDAESDEIWVLGRLTCAIADLPAVREQFGSQKHNRRRSSGTERGAILDYGFDLKGAATDALKKCASLIGVGLYLYEKEGGIAQEPAEVMIDSVREPLYQRYAKLCETAQRFGVLYETALLPIEKSRLIELGTELAEAVKLAQREAMGSPA